MIRIVLADVRIWVSVDDEDISANNIHNALSSHIWAFGEDLEGFRTESVLDIELTQLAEIDDAEIEESV
jgi:hypothetical protein